MLNVGIIGMGYMGVTHFHAWHDVPDARVIAFCSGNPRKRAGDWSHVRGNLGTVGGHVDVSRLTVCSTPGELLRLPELDLIDICLPNALHHDAVVDSLQAGTHVVVEKPIGLTVAEADAMIAASEKSPGELYVAHVLQFMPGWRTLRLFSDDQTFGRLKALNVRRVITAPGDDKRWPHLEGGIGGPMIDLHIHDVEFVLSLLGIPERVNAHALKNDEFINYAASTWQYGEQGPLVSFQCGAISASARPFHHQFEAYFENATVAHTSSNIGPGGGEYAHQSAQQPLTVYHQDGSLEFPEISDEDGFVAELRYISECIASGQPGAVLRPESARDAVAMIHAEAASIEHGQPVAVNGWVERASSFPVGSSFRRQ